MLFDIWLHFFPNDKDIHEIDKKWRKLKDKFILFHKYSQYRISRERSSN